MSTDWKAIRELMSAVIDYGEAVEAAGFDEDKCGLTVQIRGQSVSLFDFITSAYTLPESLRYQIIRERHRMSIDAPYIPETARTLKAMGEACAERVGTADARAADGQVQKAIAWYREYAVPHILKTLAAKQT